MIRQPTPASTLYAWHTDAIAGREVGRHDDDPQCGWFKMKLVKGGPWVPVEISVKREIDDDTGELTGPETLVALVNGERRAPGPIWTYLTPISRADFLAVTKLCAGRDPMKPVNLMKGPIGPNG